MASTPAKIVLHNLSNSDGSALYVSPNGTHTLQSAVHYPLDVPYRSDEAPTETYIEVSVRPHNSVAMIKERHVEEIVRRVVKSTILGEETPRCMLQVTIQMMEVEADEDLPGGVKSGGQGESYLDILVGAINSVILSCLDGGVQMKGLVGAVLVGITSERRVILSPRVRERKQCTSLHAFGYSSRGQCVLMESEGNFEFEDWEAAETVARSSVVGADSRNGTTNGDVEMNSSGGAIPLFHLMRRSVEERVIRDERWKVQA